MASKKEVIPTLRRWIYAAGGRKFLVALVSLVAVVLANVAGYEISTETQATIVGIIATFMLGNAVDK